MFQGLCTWFKPCILAIATVAEMIPIVWLYNLMVALIPSYLADFGLPTAERVHNNWEKGKRGKAGYTIYKVCKCLEKRLRICLPAIVSIGPSQTTSQYSSSPHMLL